MAGVVTYINLGNTCDVYVTPVLPEPTGVFYANAYANPTNSPFLKNTDYSQTASGTQISVTYSEYAFKAFTTQSLLTDTGVDSVLNVSNFRKRFLEPASAAEASGSSTRLTTSSTNWDTSSGSLSGTINYNGVVYTVVTTPTSLQNLFVQNIRPISSFQPRAADGSILANYASPLINYTSGNGLTVTAGGDAGAAGVTTNPPRFYLRKITTLPLTASTNFANSEVFYRSWGNTPGETDLGSIDVISSNLSSNIGHQFTFKIDSNATGGTLSVFSSGTNQNTKIDDLRCSFDAATSTITVVSTLTGSTYIPDISDISEQVSPSLYTLFRNVGNSMYVYWVGVPSTSTLGLRNYWTNGVSTAELSKRTIFMWDDLTPGSTTSVSISSGSKADLYRWKFQSATPTGPVINSGYSYLYYSKNPGNDDGGNLMFNTSFPANNNEGWALIYNTNDAASGSTGGFVGYVRNGKVIAVMQADGTLPANATAAGINLTTAPYTSAPAAGQPGYRYRCIRCSSLVTSGSSVGLCAS